LTAEASAVSVERYAIFAAVDLRKFCGWADAEMQALANETIDRMKSSLEDDLNTAQAQGAIFEMVRRVNTALDAQEIRQNEVPLFLAAMEKFDEIFAVIKDDDGPKMKQVCEWAFAEGREKISAPNYGRLCNPVSFPMLISRTKLPRWKPPAAPATSRFQTFFARNLPGAGIVIENTKDGVRWRRK